MGVSSSDLILALSVVIVVPVALAGTYLLSVIADKFCGRPLDDPRNFLNGFDQGVVSRRARIFGLRLYERKEILRRFFLPRTRTFGKTNSDNDVEQGGGLNAKNKVNDDNDDKPSSSSNKEGDDFWGHLFQPVLRVLGLHGDDKDATNNNNNVDDDGPADHEQLCCICYAEYQEGDKLMHGTVCGHLMHYDCCIDWLENHDHCPYCRVEMIQPAEFRQAAIDVLGETRVQQLGGGGGGSAVAPLQPPSANTNNNNNNNNNTTRTSAATTTTAAVELATTPAATAAATRTTVPTTTTNS